MVWLCWLWLKLKKERNIGESYIKKGANRLIKIYQAQPRLFLWRGGLKLNEFYGAIAHNRIGQHKKIKTCRPLM